MPEKWRPNIPYFHSLRMPFCAGELLGKAADLGEWEVFQKRRMKATITVRAQKDLFPMSQLTFHQALELTANFAFLAERMRAADCDFQTRANVCEAASRIAFLRAHIIAKDEQTRPAFGMTFQRAAFAVA